MPQGLGGTGVLGVAFETVLGTFVAPTKWIPIRRESLNKVENKNYRMNIRGIVDRRPPAARGSSHIEGEIEFEVTHDSVLYFLYASRLTPTKTGAGPDFTYAFVPSHVARQSTAIGAGNRKTLSVLVSRSDRPFGYTGLSVSQLAFSFDNDILICTASLLGLEEAQQSLGAQTWPATDGYGPEHSTVEIPGGASRADIVSSSLTINDNASAEDRIDGNRAVSFIRWGEREVTFGIEHDFDSLADYNVFLNQTKQQIVMKASRSATNDQLKFTLNASIADSYSVNLGGLGDLVTAATQYHATHDTSDAFSIEVKSTESIT